jgi:NAD(P)-dependent dehydrogenase (short-subunit alcohol dehydrogenase family)
VPTGVKRVLITGASGGIGSATARRLDALGWRVFAGVRSLEAGRELESGCRNVTAVQLDVCDQDSIAGAAERVAGELAGEGLDGLVNNAGLVIMGPLELVPLPALRRQFEVNVIGQIAVTQAFLPLLRAARGRVVNVSGAAGSVTVPMLGPISASKAALDSLMDALRMELKHQGVQVTSVAPGLMQTPLHERAHEARRRDGYAGTPDTQRIYEAAIAAADKALADSKEAPVDVAVAAIVKALTTARPAARYLAGGDARQLLMLRRLPSRLRDRVLMWNRGLKRDTFAAD